MRKFNFYRPLLIIAVAFLAKNLATFICLQSGVEQETAENIGYLAMMIAGLLTFMRLNKSRMRR